MMDAERLRTANLFGALALVVTDRLRAASEATGHMAATPAALVQIGAFPGESIDALRHSLDLSHSATVRIAERLETEGLIEKKRGSDGRAALLVLTDKGHAAMADILGRRRELLIDALAGLAPEDWTALTGIVEKVLPRLVTTRLESDHTCRLCELDLCPQDRCPAEPDAKLSQPR